MRWFISLTVFGGTMIFLLSFYIAGAAGIPRRFAAAHDPSSLLAAIGSIGAVILIVGLVVAFFEGVRLWRTRTTVAAGSSDMAPLRRKP